MENSHQVQETLRLMKNIATARFDYMRFTFVDFHGITRSKTVPKARVKQFFQDGCSFFAGAIGLSLVGPMVPRDIPDIKDTNSGNVLARPQTGTLHPLPLNGGPCKMGEVLCETYFPNGTTQEANPRTMARRQLELLHEMGYGLVSSWELEVTFLDEQTLQPVFKRSIMAFTNQAFDEVEEFMLHADKTFSDMGIDLETLQTEASPGQYEFVTKPTRGIRQADNLIIMKDVLRKLAKKYRKKVVFMTKTMPEPGYSAALHFNHSIIEQNGRNVFADLRDPHKLSKMCKNWLAGVLKHAPALAALTCPTVNCYRRLHTAIAPDKANWGLDNRLACCRVKNYTTEATYIESRMPSGSANPYLIMAATVAAGIDGLRAQYVLGPPIGNDGIDADLLLESRERSPDVDLTADEPEAKKAKISEDSDSLLIDESEQEAGDNNHGEEEQVKDEVKVKDDVLEQDGSGETPTVDDKVTNGTDTPEKNDGESTPRSQTPEPVLDIPYTLEEALQALEADEYMVKALGENFVRWFVEIKRNEIAHFEAFKDLTDEQLLAKERDCYMDIL